MSDDEQEHSRRSYLAGLATVVALVIGFFTGSATADDGSASGQIATRAEPAKHVYTEQVVYHPRTSDPSSPDNGTSWYRSDL